MYFMVPFQFYFVIPGGCYIVRALSARRVLADGWNVYVDVFDCMFTMCCKSFACVMHSTPAGFCSMGAAVPVAGPVSRVFCFFVFSESPLPMTNTCVVRPAYYHHWLPLLL